MVPAMAVIRMPLERGIFLQAPPRLRWPVPLRGDCNHRGKSRFLSLVPFD